MHEKSEQQQYYENLTNLAKILPYDTRWSGKGLMLRRYLKIFLELKQASD